MLRNGPVQASLLEGVSPSVLAPLQAVLATHYEAVEIKHIPWAPVDDDLEWLAPACVQLDTYWLTALMDGILGNHQEGSRDEDIQDALVDILHRVARSPVTWFGPEGEIASPLFRLRAFIEPHRSINYTIPSDTEAESLRAAIETMGDAIAYSTNVESELSSDGHAAGVFTVEMVYIESAGMWMEAHLDDDELWDEDEEDSEIV